jgi:plastocyanin
MRRFLLLLGLATLTLVSLAGPADAGGGGCFDEKVEEATTTRVVMEAVCVRPGVARVQRGDTVTVVNNDQVLHNLYGPGWYHGDLPPGDEATRTFDELGTFTYACTLHPGMTGAIIVEDAELIASSGPDADSSGMSGGTAILLTFAGLAALALVFATGLTTGRRRS